MESVNKHYKNDKSVGLAPSNSADFWGQQNMTAGVAMSKRDATLILIF